MPKHGGATSDRRTFLKGLSKATAGIALTGCGLFDSALALAQEPATAMASGSGKRREMKVGGQRVTTIDIHCHGAVREVWDLAKDHLGPDVPHDDAERIKSLETVTQALTNSSYVAQRLADMDALGFDVQVISINPFWYWMEPGLASKVVQIQNEKLAALSAAHPDRFAAMGTVALQHPDLAAEQMEDGVKKYGMHAFSIGASVYGDELSNPKYHPFWAKAEQLATLIFIHPVGLSGTGDRPQDNPRFRGNGFLGNVIGQPLETTLALTHLIQDGTLDQFPNLKICAAHGGGYLASYAGRSDQCVTAFPKDCKPLKKAPSEYLKQLYYDSIVITSEGMRHLIAEVGVNRVMLGTDYPTYWNRNGIDRVLEVPGLSDAKKVAILGGTAAKLLQINI
jgi:aminocarboxymuconate-semialdehyde decarboxylase